MKRPAIAPTYEQMLRQQSMFDHAIGNSQSGVFIDRIRITAPCLHLPCGKPIQISDPDTGEISFGATAIQQSLEDGNADVYVQSKQISHQLKAARAILVDCCPPKVLQGHNLFGHTVLQDYVYEILDRVTRALGIEVRAEDRVMWLAGNVHLTGIHLTANFTCPRELIVAIIDAIDFSNRKGKQRILPTWLTLGLTPKGRSTYHALTLYDKLAEMGEKPQPFTPFNQRLRGEAGVGFRVEVKLFSQGLKSLSTSLDEINLKNVADWAEVDVAALFFKVFDRYQVVHAVQLDPTAARLALLKPKELNVFTNWLLGRSMKEQFANRGTASRYVKVIQQKLGVNISVDRRAEVQPAVDLKELFAPENVRPVPRWAVGNKFYSPPSSPPYRGGSDADEE